jgi:uncharacterized protein with PIN domain
MDHMLIKLGKYLRILGYDAEWDPRIRTHELIRRANAEHRLFITRNTHLSHRYPTPSRCVVLLETDPVRQLQTLMADLRLDATHGPFSKCIRCNVALGEVGDKERVRTAVHPNVFARYRRFYTCPKCGTVFWKGSHVRNTCAKLQLPSAMEPEPADPSP